MKKHIGKFKGAAVCVYLLGAMRELLDPRRPSRDWTVFAGLIRERHRYAKHLREKTIIVLGDSIFGHNDTVTGICKLMENYTGAEIYNCGFGGTRAAAREESAYRFFDMANLVDAVVSGDYSSQESAAATGFNPMFLPKLRRLRKLSFQDQIVILNHGTNDWAVDIPVPTYQNSLRTILDKLLAAYPALNIVLVSPAWRCGFQEDGRPVPGSGEAVNGIGRPLLDYVSAMKEVARQRQIPFVDCYHLGIGEENCARYFDPPDGVHPARNGRIHLAKHLCAALSGLLEEKITEGRKG